MFLMIPRLEMQNGRFKQEPMEKNKSKHKIKQKDVSASRKR